MKLVRCVISVDLRPLRRQFLFNFRTPHICVIFLLRVFTVFLWIDTWRRVARQPLPKTCPGVFRTDQGGAVFDRSTPLTRRDRGARPSRGDREPHANRSFGGGELPPDDCSVGSRMFDVDYE
jgi:hypothetical protein